VLNKGDKVTYTDINLWNHVGVVEDVGSFAYGADVLVRWTSPGEPIVVGECAVNLKKRKA